MPSPIVTNLPRSFGLRPAPHINSSRESDEGRPGDSGGGGHVAPVGFRPAGVGRPMKRGGSTGLMVTAVRLGKAAEDHDRRSTLPGSAEGSRVFLADLLNSSASLSTHDLTADCTRYGRGVHLPRLYSVGERRSFRLLRRSGLRASPVGHTLVCRCPSEAAPRWILREIGPGPCPPGLTPGLPETMSPSDPGPPQSRWRYEHVDEDVAS